jgi:hypothetical protein
LWYNKYELKSKNKKEATRKSQKRVAEIKNKLKQGKTRQKDIDNLLLNPQEHIK